MLDMPFQHCCQRHSQACCLMHQEGTWKKQRLVPDAGNHMTLEYSSNTSWRPWRKLRGVQAVPVAATSGVCLTTAELPAAQGCPSQMWCSQLLS